MEQTNRGKRGFYFRNAPNTLTKSQGSALKLLPLKDACVSPNDIPREDGEFFPSSHPGNRRWQSFHCFISQLLNFPPTPLSTPTMGLMEHFPLVTSSTKFSKGNRNDTGKSQVGTWHCCRQTETKRQRGNQALKRKDLLCCIEGNQSYHIT